MANKKCCWYCDFYAKKYPLSTQRFLGECRRYAPTGLDGYVLPNFTGYTPDTGLTEADLSDGSIFPAVYDSYTEFCGDFKQASDQRDEPSDA